jgi:hypothetical protein
MYQLATIDGAPLPFTDILANYSRVVVGGTFILGPDRTFTYVLLVRNSDGAVVEESKVSGGFAPRRPTGLTFFVDHWPWADGAVQGDTLVAYLADLSDFIHAYVFVRENSS